jgi:hypothetical protein
MESHLTGGRVIIAKKGEKLVAHYVEPPEGTPEELEARSRAVIIETFGLSPGATDAEIDAVIMQGKVVQYRIGEHAKLIPVDDE